MLLTTQRNDFVFWDTRCLLGHLGESKGEEEGAATPSEIEPLGATVAELNVIIKSLSNKY